jgi:hypothetical protein
MPSNSPDGCPSFSSVVLDTPWAPRRRAVADHDFDLGARCLGHVDLNCSCGIYAFNDPAGAFNYLLQVRDRLLGRSVDVALGTVSLWGRVVECERGYRAQYAYPHHFYLPTSFVRHLGKVSSVFGVSAGIYTSTKQDEISIRISSGAPNQTKRTLHLKNSELFAARDLADEFGIYDFDGWPWLGTSPFRDRPDLSLPDQGGVGSQQGAP